MTTVERRAAVEIRVEGRRLTGVLMRYGDVSKSHRERFAPAACGPPQSYTWTSITTQSAPLRGCPMAG